MKQNIKKILSRLNKIIQRVLKKTHRSETSKCRKRLAKFCIGYGVDLGFGGDAITDHSIRIDLPSPYASTEGQSVQLGGDCQSLYWFKDATLDFVYSSHLLEDYENTKDVLKEWLRVLKTGGNLIIFCPDEEIYRKHCKKTGQYYNTNHKHADFSLKKIKKILASLDQKKIIHEAPLIDQYSWELVLQKS